MESKAAQAHGHQKGAECHLVVVLADGAEERKPVYLRKVSGIYELTFVEHFLCVSHCTKGFTCTFSFQPLVKEAILLPIYRGRNRVRAIR